MAKEFCNLSSPLNYVKLVSFGKDDFNISRHIHNNVHKEETVLIFISPVLKSGRAI